MIKARLSLLRIVEMNIGFFGLQFSFGLQQANMTPIYKFLGADEATMPLLWLAGPMTGLIVQPLIGAISDRTTSRFGRRTPYFLIGAVICSLCLLAMPYSPTLWVAASLLWLLDAGNNVTMEPYRAYVADRLEPAQQPAGFLTQSAFTGLAQCASYAAPSVLAAAGVSTALDVGNGIPQIVKIAFLIGAFLSIASIVWSVWRVPELPLEPAQIEELRARPSGLSATLADIALAVRDMPPAMRRLAVAMLFQWYAMFVYWQYISLAVSQALYGTTDAASPTYLDATLLTQQMGVLYNAIAFVGALALIPVVRRIGARWAHVVCLTASGIAMIAIGQIGSAGDVRAGVGGDDGQHLRDARQRHPAGPQRYLHGHLQHVYRHPDADRNADNPADLSPPAGGRPTPCAGAGGGADVGGSVGDAAGRRSGAVDLNAA